MRFRKGIGPFVWLSAAVEFNCARMFVDEWHSGSHTALTVMLMVSAPLVGLLNYIYTYWELQPDGFHERRLWRTKKVAWDQLTHVGNYVLSVPWDRTLILCYSRPSSKSGRGYFYPNPSDLQEFIADLHRFAPQAKFSV